MVAGPRGESTWSNFFFLGGGLSKVNVCLGAFKDRHRLRLHPASPFSQVRSSNPAELSARYVSARNQVRSLTILVQHKGKKMISDDIPKRCDQKKIVGSTRIWERRRRPRLPSDAAAQLWARVRETDLASNGELEETERARLRRSKITHAAEAYVQLEAQDAASTVLHPPTSPIALIPRSSRSPPSCAWTPSSVLLVHRGILPVSPREAGWM